MDISEFKSGLSTFIQQDNLNLVSYFLFKNGESKLADIKNDLLPELQSLYVKNIMISVLENEDLSLLPLTEADERKNVLYQYDFEEEIKPFLNINYILQNTNIQKFNFFDDVLESIDGFIVKIGNSSNSIFLFSKVYPINIYKQDKTLKLIPAKTRFEKFENQVLRINGKFDILKLNSVFYLLNYEIMEKYYHFDEVVLKKANEYFNKIESLNFLSDATFIEQYLKENIKFARKFIKVAVASPVIKLCVQPEIISDFAKKHSKLANKFKFDNNEKFILNSKKACNSFIKLLDDTFLHSQLTGIDYESKAKDEM